MAASMLPFAGKQRVLLRAADDESRDDVDDSHRRGHYTTMDAPPVTSLPAPSAIACVRCGYDLRGHDEKGRCPECGLSTYWSLNAPANLSQYPAWWVKTMARAVQMLAAAYGVVFLVFLTAAADWLPHDRSAEAFAFGILLIAAVLQMFGAWLLAKSSGHFSELKSYIARWTLRISPIGPVISCAAAVCMLEIYHHRNLETLAAVGWLGVLTPIAAFARMTRVARLISEPVLAEHSKIVSWGFFASIAALPLAGGAGHLVGGDTVTLILLVIVFASLLLFLLWGAFLMTCCIIDFGRAAKIAQGQWQARESAVSSTPHEPA
jgi:hypothetical protein